MKGTVSDFKLHTVHWRKKTNGQASKNGIINAVTELSTG